MALPSDSKTDLAWLAFRYVAGELTADEADGFERRLGQDQEAREAVAATVHLAGIVVAVRSATPAVFPMRRRSRLKVAFALAASAAACLAVVFLGRGPGESAPQTAEAKVEAGAAGAVALAWSGLRQESDREKDGTDELLAGVDESDLAPPADSDSEVVADNGPPAWLIDAAALGQGPREN